MSKMLSKNAPGPNLQKRTKAKIQEFVDPEHPTEADIIRLQSTALEILAPDGRGRPRNLPSDQDKETILGYVRRGGKVSLAFEAAGLPKTYLYTWFNFAKEGDEACVDFFKCLAMELAEFEIKLVERVIKGGAGISGAMMLLQKVAPERWGDDAVAALIKAARGEGPAQVNQTSVHIYLPDNGRGARVEARQESHETIDITPVEPTDEQGSNS
jgi:hypothetical protein